ncbi:MAG TPA: FAD-dependent oxidoreductase [Chloroflexota bacterium]|nr:FAD-dependent oxidoreductase [Chloroflexota bacterium]
MRDVLHPDVTVVGAGMAGLAAALAAQEHGARVALLEAGPEPGGSAALSAGFVATYPTYDALRAAIPLGDPDQGRVLVDGYEAAIQWLRALGVAVVPAESNEFRFGRTHHLEPPAALRHLATVFQARGGQLHTRTRAVRLTTDETGRVTGVVARQPAGLVAFASGAVVLASGGFQGNPELTTRYIGRWADRMLVRSNPHSVGDGLLMGLAVGAATSRGLHAFYGHLLPAPPAVLTPRDFLPATAYYSRYAVLVNLGGERFTDESQGDEMNAQAAARQEQATVFALFDRAVYERRILGQPPGLDRVAITRALGGRVTTAPTLEALVEHLGAWGVRTRSLARTLADYNHAMAADSDAALPVPRAAHRAPLATPEFFAVALAPAITFTHGGLRIDARCRVLDRGGQPIAGLYAAGADAGGTFYERYGGGLAMALTLGRAAGTTAAETARSYG